MEVNRVRAWESDQSLLDFVPPPQLIGASQPGLFVDEQNQWQLEQRPRLNPATRFFLDERDGKIDIFVRSFQRFGFICTKRRALKPKRWKLLTKFLQQFRNVIVQDNRRRGDPQLWRTVLAHFFRDDVDVIEERSD